MYYVYILANKPYGVLYIGVTNGLENRANEHKYKVSLNSFTAKYNICKLVYYEVFQDIEKAIEREKQLKKWKRAYKYNLISKHNSAWNDLSVHN